MSYDNLRVLFFLLRPLWPIRFPQAICIRPIQQSNYSAGGQFAHERIYARTVVTHGGLTRHVMRPRESKQKAVCLILSCVCARRKADAYPAVVYCTCTVPIDAIASSPYQQQQVYMLLFHVGQRSVHLIQDLFSQLSPFRLAYQPPANSTFLSEQTRHQPSTNNTSISEQISTGQTNSREWSV
jgi:hypothetical protein